VLEKNGAFMVKSLSTHLSPFSPIDRLLYKMLMEVNLPKGCWIFPRKSAPNTQDWLKKENNFSQHLNCVTLKVKYDLKGREGNHKFDEISSTFRVGLWCVVWPTSGYQSYVHIFSREDKQGWQVFLRMLRSSLMKQDYLGWHSSITPARTYDSHTYKLLI
ncbi:hypothetical protein Csa_018445, partial [Cucumis sativus]